MSKKTIPEQKDVIIKKAASVGSTEGLLSQELMNRVKSDKEALDEAEKERLEVEAAQRFLVETNKKKVQKWVEKFSNLVKEMNEDGFGLISEGYFKGDMFASKIVIDTLK